MDNGQEVQLFQENAEVALLGIVLQNPELIYNLTNIKPFMFSSEPHIAIYSAMCELLEKQTIPEPILLINHLKSEGRLTSAGGEATIKYLASQKYNPQNLKEFERQLIDTYKSRKLISTISGIPTEIINTGRIDSIILNLKEFLNKLEENSGTESTQLIGNLVEPVYEEILKRLTNPGKNGTPFGVKDVDAVTGGVASGETWVVAARPSMGKAQPLDSLVLTPTGFKTMREINDGDLIIGEDGKSHKVIKTFPQGLRPIYRVSFSDGSTVECDEEHLWEVSTRNNRKNKKDIMEVLTTKEIINRGVHVENPSRNNFAVNYVKPVEFNSQKVELDPYLLGLLLGDGCMRKDNIRFSSTDEFLVQEIRNRISTKESLGKPYNIDYRVSENGRNNPDTVKNSLKSMKLYGKGSHTKFIPKNYLYNSIEVRKEILSGILDTDGSVWNNNKNNFIDYVTVSKQLADDVKFLCQSLGGRVVLSEKKCKYKKYGININTGIGYRLTISFNGYNPFKLPRKKELYGGNFRSFYKFISNIEYVGEKEAKCILVDSESHLYVTNDFVVTHNTAVMCNSALQSAKAGNPVLIFSLEMQKEAIIERFLAIETGIPLTSIRLGNLKKDEVDVLKDKLRELKELPIYLDCSPNVNLNYIMATIRKYHKNNGIKLAYLDYLQLLAERDDTQTAELGRISRNMKLLAVELKIGIVLLSQLNRQVEMRDDKRPILSDLRQSGNIEEDCDLAIFLYRDDYYHEDSTELNVIEFLIRKNRNGVTGMIKLKFNAESNKVT